MFRRVFNTRGLVYAGIAVAFAALIMVVEWQEQAPGPNLAKEAALSAQRVEGTADEQAGHPPAIQATRESVLAAANPSAAPMVESAPAASKKPADSLALKSAPKPPGSVELGGVERGYGFTRRFGEAGKAGRAPEADKKAPVAQEVLVVHCDASAEAIANHDFEKLLAANGIQRSRRIDVGYFDDKAKAGGDVAAENSGGARMQRKGGKKALPPPPDDLLIYVEATPEQIEATLAALAGRPKAFSNVSVNPPQAIPPANLAFSRPDGQTQAGAVAGEESREKSPARSAGKAAQPKASPRGGEMFGAPQPANGPAAAEKAPAPAAPNPAAVEDANKRDGSNAKAKEPEKVRSRQEAKSEKDNRQSQPPSQTQPPTQPAARQRVLFVLRNVGGAQPPVAAARVQAAEQTEGSKSQAQQAAPPAKKPAKGK